MRPVADALAHNAGALLIVLNSVRLLDWKYTPGRSTPLRHCGGK